MQLRERFLLRGGIPVVNGVAAGVFVDMLQSPIWSDRNKAGHILELLTVSRDPKLMASLREHSVGPLLEMAAWGDEDHAQCYRIILGRICGMPEDDVRKLSIEPGGEELILSLIHI